MLYSTHKQEYTPPNQLCHFLNFAKILGESILPSSHPSKNWDPSLRWDVAFIDSLLKPTPSPIFQANELKDCESRNEIKWLQHVFFA